MPSAQVINLNPEPRTELTPLEKTLSAFSQRTRENQIEAQDTDALRSIYGKYQQDGRNLEDALIAIQTRPGLSPTARVNSAKQLMEFHKYNQDLQKKAQKDVERSETQAENRRLLQEAGATPEQVKLYEAAPVGGQTEIIKDIVETKKRAAPPPGVVPSDVQDFDSGLTPSERVKRQDDRFKIQTPLVNENNKSLAALENEEMSIDLLNELNDTQAVGTGLSKLNINPKTGDLIIPQFASPEEQLFVKTINDFTVKAKDSFGARVTNFELDRFMQRLPTLANSQQGRALILRQMKIINDLNQLEKKAVQGVFDQYGVRNIDYVSAENIARSKIADQKDALRKDFLNLESLAKREDSELIKNIKDRVQPGYTAMRKPDGTIKQFPTQNVPNLEEKGYTKL